MARRYAGILGLLAFLVVLVRGVLHGAPESETIYQAWLALLLFAAVGYGVGWLAAWTVDDALRSKLLAELTAQEHQQQTASETTGPREA